MYEARENKKKVSRTIGAAGGETRQKQQMRDEREYIQKKIMQTCLKNSNINCLQFMLTRSQVNNIIHKIYAGEDSLYNYNQYDQILIAERARDRGIDISQCNPYLLSNIIDRNLSADGDSDIDHPDTADAPEIPFVSPEQALQLKRGPGFSGPRTISPYFTNGYYKRDLNGNIDFDNIDRCNGNFQSPVRLNSLVNLEEGSYQSEYGVLLNGNKVHIPNASRSQHFSIANRIAKKHGQVSGNGGNSPDKLTWHHLVTKYQMVLVDRTVHQKFGHNGGYYFW